MRKNRSFLKKALRVLLCFALIVGLFACIRPEAKALEEGDVVGMSGKYSATLSPDNTGEDFYNFITTKSNNLWNQSPHYSVDGSYIRNVITNTNDEQIEVKLSDCKSATFTDGTYYVYLYTHNNQAGDSRINFYHKFTVNVQVRYTIGYSASGAPGGYGGIKVNDGNASNSGSVTVVPDGTVKFEVVSVPGHTAAVDTGGAAYSKSGNTYTYSSVNQKFDFKVTYTPTDYATVTFTQPEGATITVNGSTTSPVQVISGMNYNVSVAAATGYQLTGVKFDGTSQTVTNDATSSFTFTAGANGTTHTVSASTQKHTITVEDTATFYFNRGMTSSQIVTGLFNTIYKGSTLNNYTASDVKVKYDDGDELSLQYWGGSGWINLTDSILTWDKLVHSIEGLQMQFRLSNGTITSNTCTVTLIDNSISANGTISKPYTGEAVSLSMTNGEDFTWTTHSGYASSSLAVYQYYDSSKNPISAPSAVGSYYARLRLTEHFEPIAGYGTDEISYSDYIPFSITKATLNSITIPDTIVPVVGGAPVSSVSDFGFNATITWSPIVRAFAYNSEYTATVTLTSDSNCVFAENAAVIAPAGTVSSNVTYRTTDQIVVELTFKTAAAPVTNTPKNVETTYTADFSYDVTQLFTLDTNAGTPTYTLVAGGTGAGALDAENRLTITRAGTFQIQVTTDAKDIYAAGEAVTATLTVNKGTQAALTITGQPGTVTYGDVFTLGAEGGTTGGTVTWAVTSGSDFATVNASTGEGTVIGVGGVTITATMAGDDLYDVVSSSYTFTSAKKVVTISGTTIKDKVYDGNTTATVENSGTVSGAAFGDVLSVNVTSAVFTDENAAGDKTVYLSFALTGDNANCYQIDTANSDMTATATISPLDISTGAEVGDFEALTYNGKEQTPVASVTKNDLPVTGEWSKVTDVADKTTFTANGNFTGTIENQEDGMLPLNIADAEITLGETLTYNGEEQTQTVTKVMVGELEVTTYEVTGDVGTAADSYTLTVTGNTNFTGTATKGFTIAPKPVTVTANDQSYHIGTELPETIEVNKHYTIEGLVAGDSLGTITVKYQKDGEDVTPNVNQTDTYDIVPVVTDPNANYDITLVNGKLTYYYIPTYTPAVEETDGGDVTISNRYPAQGQTVTITPKPDEGMLVDTVIVTDKNGNPVEIIDNGDGTYSFRQPIGKVTITVTFKLETCPSEEYFDLNTNAWYHEATDYVLQNGLMNGIGDGKFDPNGVTSRAMVVTILWRLEGEPVVNYLMQFEDVPADTWYTEAVRWAASEGIVTGYSDIAFGPNDNITREQLATILYRYEQSKGGGFTGAWMFLLDYTDRDAVSEWAYEAMCWMTMNRVIEGKGDGILDPKGRAMRCEAAQMLMNYLEQ